MAKKIIIIATSMLLFMVVSFTTNALSPVEFIAENTSKVYQIAEQNKPDAKFESIGQYRITGYCSCVKCCGKWANNRGSVVLTASGNVAKSRTTVACNGLPFGTQLLIDGQVYVVEDRTANFITNTVDIYFDNHNDAWNCGCTYKNVYIIH